MLPLCPGLAARFRSYFKTSLTNLTNRDGYNAVVSVMKAMMISVVLMLEPLLPFPKSAERSLLLRETLPIVVWLLVQVNFVL